MTTNRTRIRMLDTCSEIRSDFRKGVSLHCHTQHSKESLDFIPHYAERIPVVSNLFKRARERYREDHGHPLDFSRAYWMPPLPARKVFELEAQQVETRLGLEALVSLTDHDDIEAGVLLQTLESYRNIPISLEWTVPFRRAYFHVGVHNIPAAVAGRVMSELKRYTTAPDPNNLGEIFAGLNEHPGILLVLNHPVWDMELAGKETHMALLTAFLSRYGRWIHALEVNGYRSWRENKLTIQIAEHTGFPIVSGGDRHGLASNVVLNLTAATSFDEFVSEVRCDKKSEVVLMPEYRENLMLRTMEAAADVLRYYPSYPEGLRFWTDRVFHQMDQDVVRPLSYYWKKGGPAWVRSCLGVMYLLGSPRFRPALRFALAKQQELAL
jgi:hypothetical protein